MGAVGAMGEDVATGAGTGAVVVTGAVTGAVVATGAVTGAVVVTGVGAGPLPLEAVTWTKSRYAVCQNVIQQTRVREGEG